jgi:hypothetical protein
VCTFPFVVVERTEGLNTSPLNKISGLMSENDFTAVVNLEDMRKWRRIINKKGLKREKEDKSTLWHHLQVLVIWLQLHTHR